MDGGSAVVSKCVANQVAQAVVAMLGLCACAPAPNGVNASLAPSTQVSGVNGVAGNPAPFAQPDAGASPVTADAGSLPTVQMREQSIEVPPQCQGFTIRGARYSPGGSVLPNTCAPFHPSLNNQWFLGYELPQLLTFQMEPDTTRDSHYVMGLKAETRILSLLGHRHAWTSNMSAWVKRADGITQVLYQSFDRSDIPTYRYDSLATNPQVESDARIDRWCVGNCQARARRCAALQPSRRVHRRARDRDRRADVTGGARHAVLRE